MFGQHYSERVMSEGYRPTTNQRDQIYGYLHTYTSLEEPILSHQQDPVRPDMPCQPLPPPVFSRRRLTSRRCRGDATNRKVFRRGCECGRGWRRTHIVYECPMRLVDLYVPPKRTLARTLEGVVRSELNRMQRACRWLNDRANDTHTHTLHRRTLPFPDLA